MNDPLDRIYDSLSYDLKVIVEELPDREHGKYIQRALSIIARLAQDSIDTLDWKILSASLRDLEIGFTTFYPYRHIRKVTIFGSARVEPTTPEYQMAVEFARHVSEQGFMVMTGAGGGIMQAGNEGAGAVNSFGLNIELPFEQGANQFIEGDPKLLNFRYFFTRKLFLLRESDAIALFPGGFGTHDEALECLTLCQTGRYGPVPMILINPPGSTYWQDWDAYIQKHLIAKGLVSPEDSSLYKIADNLEVAYETINHFYRVYHSSRYVRDLCVIRLQTELCDPDIERLNAEFSDILVKGKIEKCQTLPEEFGDETEKLPRICLYFNQRDFGRMYQMIDTINHMEFCTITEEHPEIK